MFAIISCLLSSIRRGFRTRATLPAEILALRHQLFVLHRANRDRQLRLNSADRLLWVLCSSKIQSRHRIVHFEEPTSLGLDRDIGGFHCAVATLCVRAAVCSRLIVNPVLFRIGHAATARNQNPRSHRNQHTLPRNFLNGTTPWHHAAALSRLYS